VNVTTLLAFEGTSVGPRRSGLKARPDIHVVFTDIQMSGSMDGLKLAHFVRGRWPPVKIVATSGHHAFKDGDLPEGGVFLPKPYSFDTLSSILRELAA
jgi:two-component system, response regulator PdtaR